MKKIIALAALAAAVLASPAFASPSKSSQQVINGYTLEQWRAGAPSPGTSD
jgi:hypothetical protein